MKINEQPPIRPTEIGGAAPAAARARNDVAATDPSATGAGAPAARVELSARSRELHEALMAAQAAPDVRAEVVADVRARLDAGTYRIDPERIARGLLDTKA